MVMPRHVKFFVVLMGSIFILSSIALSVATELPNIIAIGMGIIGIFLLILPYTFVGRKQ